jgi:hypothetical protein
MIIERVNSYKDFYFPAFTRNYYIIPVRCKVYFVFTRTAVGFNLKVQLQLQINTRLFKILQENFNITPVLNLENLVGSLVICYVSFHTIHFLHIPFQSYMYVCINYVHGLIFDAVFLE